MSGSMKKYERYNYMKMLTCEVIFLLEKVMINNYIFKKCTKHK